jgi:hypothetical protein
MARKLLYGGGGPKSSLYGGGSRGNVYRPGMGGDRTQLLEQMIGGEQPGPGGQPGPGIGGQPGQGIGGMRKTDPRIEKMFEDRRRRREKKKEDTGYKRRKRTGNRLFDEYQRAWDDARIENERRYEDILQGSEDRYSRGMEAMEGSEQLVKDRYLKERGNIRQDMTSRGLSGMTSIQTAQGIANRAQQLGIQDIRRDRAELDARLSADVLGFKERRTDAYPDYSQLAAMSQGLGEYGGTGYGSYGSHGSHRSSGFGQLKTNQNRSPGLQINAPSYGTTPQGRRQAHVANLQRMAGEMRTGPGMWHRPSQWQKDEFGQVGGSSRGHRPQDLPTHAEVRNAMAQLSQSDFGGPGGGYMGMRGPRRMNPMQQMMMMMAMMNQNRGGGGGGPGVGQGGGGGLNAPVHPAANPLPNFNPVAPGPGGFG